MSIMIGYVIVITCGMPRNQVTFINKALSDFLASQAMYPVAAVSYTAYLMQYVAWWDWPWPVVTNFFPEFLW